MWSGLIILVVIIVGLVCRCKFIFYILNGYNLVFDVN